MTEQPGRPGIEERSLEILEHNTIAVLSSAPDRLDDWRATVAQALEDTLERSPGDVAEIALFQAILSLLAGGSPSLPEGHRYYASLGRILAFMEAPCDPYANIGGQLNREQLHGLLQGTAGVFTGAVDREAWRAGLAHALQDAQGRGDAWMRESELFGALIALVDGDTPELPKDHPYVQVLSDTRSAVELAQDPTVAALNAWINAEDEKVLISVWREYEDQLRFPTTVEHLGALIEHARADLADPVSADLMEARLDLLKQFLQRGDQAAR